jgi:hypothetical protein
MNGPYPPSLFDRFKSNRRLSPKRGPTSLSNPVSGDYRDISFVKVIRECFSGFLDLLDDVIARRDSIVFVK